VDLLDDVDAVDHERAVPRHPQSDVAKPYPPKGRPT
jgi:hypothetical protein